MNRHYFLYVLIRYLLLFLLGINTLWVFYLVFTPLTLYPVYFFLSLFFNAALIGNSIIISEIPIELVNACIAGSAYYLLLVLNLSTPGIHVKKRLTMIVLSFLILLIINILRIFFLSLLYLKGSSLFDITHIFFWYFVSIIFVILIWFAEVKLFKIKQVPFYSDINYFYKLSILKKKKR